MKYTTVILALVASVFAVPQASITSAPAAAPIPSGLTPAVSCVLEMSCAKPLVREMLVLMLLKPSRRTTAQPSATKALALLLMQ
jgi:hypothetical protein